MISKGGFNVRNFNNPILPGFYPDPSICRVGEDYYLVTSSFSYFPGVPIFHSKDLVNWFQIGHVLDRATQLPLDGLEQSEGIFAPTIRYNKGIFYMITTNVGAGGNFIVTSTNPEGPWSEPYYLDALGIDPSLYFDEDGKTYYTGTRVAEVQEYDGDTEIWLQELDINSMKLVGQISILWKGALKNAIWPEGPHIYKVEGYYYLMISEGGTGQYHSVTIARSKDIKGKYEGNPSNPILTHRHLGKDYPISNVGHCDLVETQNGEWWAVGLASRPYGGYYRNLGRETFLFPVKWEDGWPIMSPGEGRLKFEYPIPKLHENKCSMSSSIDNFNNDKLGYEWNFLRTPREKFIDLSSRPGYLGLKLKPEKITELASPSFVGRRQQHINFTAITLMDFTPSNENEVAGIVLLQSNRFNYSFLSTITFGKKVIRLLKCVDGKEEIIAEKEISSAKLYLEIQALGQEYSFYYGEDINNLIALEEKADGRILSTDIAGGFVGTVIGLYASSKNTISDNWAYFDWFEYLGQ